MLLHTVSLDQRTVQVVVDLPVLRQCRVVRAVTQTENRLEIGHVHAGRQLSAPVPNLEKKTNSKQGLL